MDLERMHREAAGAARFLLVYVREAHALDEWVTADNTKAVIEVIQPTTTIGRCVAADRMCSQLDITVPAVVDTLDDRVSGIYGAWPDRLYLLDEAGVVVHKTAVGPFGFRPAEIREALVSRWGMELSPTTYEPPQLRQPPPGAPRP